MRMYVRWCACVRAFANGLVHVCMYLRVGVRALRMSACICEHECVGSCDHEIAFVHVSVCMRAREYMVRARGCLRAHVCLCMYVCVVIGVYACVDFRLRALIRVCVLLRVRTCVFARVFASVRACTCARCACP